MILVEYNLFKVERLLNNVKYELKRIKKDKDLCENNNKICILLNILLSTNKDISSLIIDIKKNYN